MPILNFKEIPEAHKGGGQQDTFELFAEEFFELLGYTILRSPSRGADGGKDLVLEEERQGKVGQTRIKYLVSCKHKAHSGSAVSPVDEQDIADRVKANGCDAFLGFYSTVPTTGLDTKLCGLGIESHTFSPRKIEKTLLKTSEGMEIVQRYFPTSYSNWSNQNPTPTHIFSPPAELNCEICGRDLLTPLSPPKFLGGVVGYCIPLTDAEDNISPDIVDVRFYCKGRCTTKIERRLKLENLWEDGWEDIHEFMHPAGFIFYLLDLVNRPERFNALAARKFSDFLKSTFPFVSRKLTKEEQAHLDLITNSGAMD